MKWFTVSHIESFRGKRPDKFLDAILARSGSSSVFSMPDDEYGGIRKKYLSMVVTGAHINDMSFEELCKYIETLPEPIRSDGLTIVAAKRNRISKSECAPCEKAKAVTSIRYWLQSRGVPAE